MTKIGKKKQLLPFFLWLVLLSSFRVVAPSPPLTLSVVSSFGLVLLWGLGTRFVFMFLFMCVLMFHVRSLFLFMFFIAFSFSFHFHFSSFFCVVLFHSVFSCL